MTPIKVIIKAQGLDLGEFGSLVFDLTAIKDQEVLDKTKLLTQIKELNLPKNKQVILELSKEILFDNVIDPINVPIAPTNLVKIGNTATNRELYLVVKWALNQTGWQVNQIYPEDQPEINLLPKPWRQTLEKPLLFVLFVSLLSLMAVLIFRQWK